MELWMPCCLAIYSSSLQKLAQRAKVEIQVVFFQAELLPEPVYLLSLLHQGQPQPLDLVVREGPGLNAPDSLALQQFVEQFHQGQDQLSQAVLDIVLIQIDPGGVAVRRSGRQRGPALHDLDKIAD